MLVNRGSGEILEDSAICAIDTSSVSGNFKKDNSTIASYEKTTMHEEICK